MQKDREVDRGRCALQLGFRSDILKQVVFEELIIKKEKVQGGGVYYVRKESC